MSASTETRSGAAGRQRLLAAAERLFAERGIGAVSLREIHQAADHRNASGVQYHFGGRDGLLRAVIERHMTVVDVERATRLDDLDLSSAGSEAADGRQLMTILVAPLAERLHDRSGRNYLRILQHLVDEPGLTDQPERLAGANKSLARVTQRLGRLTSPLPPAIRAERQSLMTSFLLRALADRASAIDSGRRPRLAHAPFTANLVDVLLAVLTTPGAAPA